MYCDIKYVYLGTPFERYEYIIIPITMFPDEIIQEYKVIGLLQH